MNDKNYFIELNSEKHRLLVIEYFDGKPCTVITEKHWDHSREPWFRVGKDTPSGICRADFDFNYSKNHETLYWHNSGGGGNRSRYVIGELINCKCKIWVAPDIELTKYVKFGGEWVQEKITPSEIVEYGYTVLDEPIEIVLDGKASINPFEISHGDTPCIYCPLCKDYLPDDSFLCEHTRWCDECCSWILTDTKESIDGDGVCKHENEEE